MRHLDAFEVRLKVKFCHLAFSLLLLLSLVIRSTRGSVKSNFTQRLRFLFTAAISGVLPQLSLGIKGRCMSQHVHPCCSYWFPFELEAPNPPDHHRNTNEETVQPVFNTVEYSIWKHNSKISHDLTMIEPRYWKVARQTKKQFLVVVDSAECKRWRGVSPLSAAVVGSLFRSVGWSKVEQVVLRNCHGRPTPAPSFVSTLPRSYFPSNRRNLQELVGGGRDERGSTVFCVRRNEREACERGAQLWMCKVPLLWGGCPVSGASREKKVNMRRGRVQWGGEKRRGGKN